MFLKYLCTGIKIFECAALHHSVWNWSLCIDRCCKDAPNCIGFCSSSVTRLNTLANARYVLCKCTAQFFNGHVSENIRKLKMEDFLNSRTSLHFHFPGREAQIAEKGQNKVKAGECALPAKKCFHYPLQIWHSRVLIFPEFPIKCTLLGNPYMTLISSHHQKVCESLVGGDIPGGGDIPPSQMPPPN